MLIIRFESHVNNIAENVRLTLLRVFKNIIYTLIKNILETFQKINEKAFLKRFCFTLITRF